MRPIELVALDMAGTTVADDGAVKEAFREALDAVGLTAGQLTGDPQEYIRRTMGQSKIVVFTELLGGDRHRAEQANTAFEVAFDRAVDRGEVAPVPGAEASLARLRAAGMRLCLTTGFSPVTRDRIVSALGWEGLVDLVLSPADAGRGRPWPDMILTAVLRLRIDDVAHVAVEGTPRATCWPGPDPGPRWSSACSAGPTRELNWPPSRGGGPPRPGPPPGRRRPRRQCWPARRADDRPRAAR